MDLEQRIKHLEKQGSVLKILMVFVLLFAFSGLALGTAMSGNKIVEAQKIVLRDAKGKVRAELSGHDGSLSLYDEKGHLRISLWTGLDSQLEFLDARKQPVVTFGSLDGKGYLYLYKSDNKYGYRASVRLDMKYKGPRISLRDERNQDRAVLGSIPLKKMNTDEVVTRPESSLVLINKDGKVLRSLP